jgi:hypothetical protein
MFRWNYSEREAELVLWGESNFDMRHNVPGQRRRRIV